MPKHIWLHFTATDLNTELLQLADEGRDVSSLQSEIDWLKQADFDLAETQARFNAFMDAAQGLPENPDEPNDLEAIRALRPADRPRLGTVGSGLENRIRGAWLGRVAGCLLGKPIEGMRSYAVFPILEASDNRPLRRYFHSEDVEPGYWDRIFGEGHFSKGFLIDRIKGAPEDDDTNYTTTALAIVDKYGRDFTSDDVADFWLDNIPILRTCTAERAAYRNLVEGFTPPASAARRNPYREWIGAQIRADYWGYINPGDPQTAAEMAWRDARVTHVKNGIYGEMWVAAMLAAAFCTDDLKTVILAGLGEIPRDSRLAVAVRDVMAWREAGVTYDEATLRIRERYDEDDWHLWTHTITNALIVVIGLLWGENDYALSICRAVEGMYDTDCNGATVGSIVGAIHGARALPKDWTAPLNDKLETGVKGYNSVSISGMASKTMSHLPLVAAPA